MVRYTPDVVEVLSDTERADGLARQQALQSIRVLARAVDAKDSSTREHSERVADVAVQIAHVLGWDLPRAAELRESGLVHDVGKIAVPDSILFKPSRLTEGEFEIVKQHAAVGAEMVGDVLTDKQVSWVRGHHERWDGRGYPDGLAGEMIPTGARILALADSWDVMTAERPYSASRSSVDALEECRRCSGAQFWPVAVDALARLCEAGALIHHGSPMEMRASSGREAGRS
ncbi:MAG: HD-GYP domain-containing protein [Miltoncostaeaceae bacterium]